MTNLLLNDKNIENMIYEIRGQQVMIDRDLARLYHVETKVFMQSVKRNIKRFPENFMFQLTKEEFTNWRSQFVTSKNDKIGLRRAPYAFTEHGVAMLSGILKSETAINTSISIIEAFVSMRHYINDNKDIYITLNNLSNKMAEYDEKLDLIFSKFENKEKLFLPGEEYDAYSYIFNLLKDAKEELIIIDPYADLNLLDMIRNINCKIILIMSSKTTLSEKEINKFNKQYNKLKVFKNKKIHDRYFILDKKTIYHCGTSINYAGKKMFSISLLEDDFIKKNILNYINNVI